MHDPTVITLLAAALGWLTQRLASQLAEIGVILLMFGVGLHFHPKEPLRVWRIAVPGAVAQSIAATVFGWAIALALGWTSQAGLILGMARAVVARLGVGV